MVTGNCLICLKQQKTDCCDGGRKAGKMMDAIQKSQQKTDSTLSAIMNEIHEIRKSQEYLSCKFEEMKNELVKKL